MDHDVCPVEEQKAKDGGHTKDAKRKGAEGNERPSLGKRSHV